MGSTNTNCKAKDGIDKLIQNKSLIKKYLNKSVLERNKMNTRCIKKEIPGEEIEQNSTFYIYNIEGFFDIEKGLYFSLIELFETIKYCEKHEIDIKNYEDLENYYDALLIAMKTINCICETYQMKNGEISEKEKKEMSEQEKEEMCKNICEKKIENEFKSSSKIEVSWKGFSYVKTEEKFTKQQEKIEQNSQVLEILNNFSFTDLETFSTLFIGMALKFKEKNNFISKGIKNAINLLSNIIPFNQLKEIISISTVYETISGLANIYKAYNSVKQNKLPLAAIQFITGALELGKPIFDTYIKSEKVSNQKKKTKAQGNFLELINKIENLFEILINSNLQELKNNNIIILGVDSSENYYNEGVDLQLTNIDGIEQYAKVLSDGEQDRVKYIKNMIHFYKKINPKLSQLTNKGENDKKETFEFLVYFQEFIKNFNNKDFWIKMNEENIDEFVDYLENEYKQRTNYFKEHSNEIIKQYIQSLKKDEETNEKKKNETFKVEKPLSNNKVDDTPAPAFDS